MDLRERPSAPFERHPWELARARFVGKLLRDRGLLPGAASVLDVGSGDGWLATELAGEHPETSFVCWDRFYRDADIDAISRTNLTATRRAPDEAAALALALDVLEHVEDDAGFLAEIAQRLEARGHLLITVPAHPILWTHHDALLEHHRRYSRSSLAALIATSELEILASGGLFHSLLVPRAAAVIRERLIARPAKATAVASWKAPRLVTRAVGAALAFDNAISRLAARASVPLPGLSLWALCRRPS